MHLKILFFLFRLFYDDISTDFVLVSSILCLFYSLFSLFLCSSSRNGSGVGYQKRNPGEEQFCRDNFLSISALQMIDQVSDDMTV